MGRIAFSSEADRLLTKQVNLYRLQELVDGLVLRGAKNGSPFSFTEELIKRLHFVATHGLLTEPGTYRTGDVQITNSAHRPPSWLEVPGHMSQLCLYINREWQNLDLVRLAAIVMWRLNWIHPFENGNGRTSRAASYLVMCAKHGALLPAKNSIVTQIMQNKDPYNKALRACDVAHAASGGGLTCEPMEQLIAFLLKEQIKASLS
jgi:Fic family protein